MDLVGVHVLIALLRAFLKHCGSFARRGVKKYTMQTTINHDLEIFRHCASKPVQKIKR